MSLSQNDSAHAEIGREEEADNIGILAAVVSREGDHCLCIRPQTALLKGTKSVHVHEHSTIKRIGMCYLR